MYLRTVFGSFPVRRAMAETERPWRCRFRIMMSSPSLTTVLPLFGCARGEDGRSVGRSASRASREAVLQGANWGKFDRHYQGEFIRRSQNTDWRNWPIKA